MLAGGTGWPGERGMIDARCGVEVASGIAGVNLNLPADEIVAFVREVRER